MVVDDHATFRRGLRELLAPLDDVDVVAEAGSADEALAEAERTRPDLVVMDVRLVDNDAHLAGRGSGIEATREIRSRHPETQVVMLTAFPDDEALVQSVLAGASGYVLKDIDEEPLIEAVRTVGAGGSLLDPTTIALVVERLRVVLGRGEKLARLNEREEQILRLLPGHTNRGIGAELGLAEGTVRNYVSVILDKLEVRRREDAAAYYLEHGTLAGDRSRLLGINDA